METLNDAANPPHEVSQQPLSQFGAPNNGVLHYPMSPQGACYAHVMQGERGGGGAASCGAVLLRGQGRGTGGGITGSESPSPEVEKDHVEGCVLRGSCISHLAYVPALWVRLAWCGVVCCSRAADRETRVSARAVSARTLRLCITGGHSK